LYIGLSRPVAVVKLAEAENTTSNEGLSDAALVRRPTECHSRESQMTVSQTRQPTEGRAAAAGDDDDDENEVVSIDSILGMFTVCC